MKEKSFIGKGHTEVPNKEQTDEQLAEACRRLDHRAFQILMERYLPAILNFVRQYAKVPEDADDITQETFFKVWKYIGRYKKGKGFRPWLYTIARNTALDHLKRKRSVSFSSLDDADNDLNFEDTLQDTEPLQTEIFENAQLAEKLSEKILLIEPDYRIVMTLRYHDEMTFEEIAEIVGKPMNTIKSWHHRTLVRLRELLKDDLHQIE